MGCVRASATTSRWNKRGFHLATTAFIYTYLSKLHTHVCLYLYSAPHMKKWKLWCAHYFVHCAHCTCSGGTFDFLILCIKSRPPHCIDQSSRLQISMPFWTSMADAAAWHGFFMLAAISQSLFRPLFGRFSVLVQWSYFSSNKKACCINLHLYYWNILIISALPACLENYFSYVLPTRKSCIN